MPLSKNCCARGAAVVMTKPPPPEPSMICGVFGAAMSSWLMPPCAMSMCCVSGGVCCAARLALRPTSNRIDRRMTHFPLERRRYQADNGGDRSNKDPSPPSRSMSARFRESNRIGPRREMQLALIVMNRAPHRFRDIALARRQRRPRERFEDRAREIGIVARQQPGDRDDRIGRETGGRRITRLGQL